LYTGSRGSLCVILEATLRLFPLPEDECHVNAVAADRAQLLEMLRAVMAAPLRPIALCAARIDPPQERAQWLIAVQLGARREVLAQERAAIEQLWPSARILQGAEARSEAELLRDKEFGAVDGPVLRVFLRPAALASALESLEALLATSGDLAPHWWLEPGVARIDIALRERNAGAADLAGITAKARALLAPLGARVQLLHALDTAQALAPLGAGAALMSAIREQLDPTGVFAAGSSHGPR
jgi:FAD/FMN-containing dehydrogenase